MATFHFPVVSLLFAACAFPLFVNARINIEVAPRSAGVLLGQDLVLDCVASETDGLPLNYHWDFNGTLSDSPLLPNNSLFVARVARSNLGPYMCIIQVAGQPGSTISSPKATIVKAYIDDFTHPPQTQVAVNGSIVTLECVTGYSAPPATVHWEKDGTIFTGGTQESGTFGSVEEGGAIRTSMKLELQALTDDEGLYSCTAQNPLTRETVRSAPANLTVQIPPESPAITRQPPLNPTAPAFLPFTLECTASGYPPPEIRWHLGNALLANSGRVYTMPNGSLHFTDLREGDAGSYKCSAANIVGVAVSDLIMLTVAVLDVDFERGPSDVNILGGQPVTLQCRPPRSIPPARVLWYMNDAPFVTRMGDFAAGPQPDGSLHFMNVQVTDEGHYFCVAVNEKAVPSSRTSQTATIMVQASPLIMEPPVPQRIIKGQLLSLTCRILGRPTPTVHWFKDNEEVISGPRLSFQNSKMELLIMSTNKDDEGMYRCSASNRLGNSSSASVLVFVVIPPEIVQPPEDATMRAGSQVLVPCLVYGDPVPTITWYKDGEVLTSQSRVNISRDGLTIYDAGQQDEGTYECRAVNEGGRKMAAGELRIEVKPVLNSYPNDKHVPENQPLVLYCQGSGYPPPRYYWMYNGSKTLPTDFDIREGGRQLIIQSIMQQYSGMYSCIAENVAGSDSRTITVLVTVAPQITTLLGDLEVDQGDDLHLTCDVSGSPQPIVTWSFDGDKILPTSDSRVSFPEYNQVLIRFAKGDNSGRYQCLAENSAGSDKLTMQVTVLETPLPPVLSSARAISMTSVNVSWIAMKDDSGNKITSWVIEYKPRLSEVFQIYRNDLPAGLRSHEVSGLQPFTEYVFRVAGKNHLGIGSFSASLSAQTLESAPSEPRNLQMESHNATSVALRWEIPARTNGIIRSYQVHYRRKYEGDEFQYEEFRDPMSTLQRRLIYDLEPYTTYEIKVRGATIEQGQYLWGTFSKPIDITTSAMVPSAAPPNVRVQVLSSRAVNVSWQALPEEYHHGLLQAYIITYVRTHTIDTIREQRVNVPATYTIITGLLPWRYYDFRVMAYNQKGRGVSSDAISVRTSPEVPTGRPSSVEAQALSDTSINVKWQPIPLEERNSEISGYVVEYMNLDIAVSDTLSQDIGNPSITTLNITGLLPWTQYQIQVRGFTTQLSNGFSPASPPVHITTLEGLPGPVRNLTVTAFPTSADLTWEPPLRPNGVIKNYVVSYVIVTPTLAPDNAQNPQIPRRVVRDVGKLLANTTYELIIADETNATVTGLQSEFTYAFSVVAETSAGRALSAGVGSMATVVLPAPAVTVPPVVVDVSTEDLTATTMFTMRLTEDPATQASPADQTSNHLPLIIGASVAGGVVVLTLLIIAAVCCFRHQRNTKGIYFIPPPAFAQQSLADMQIQEAPSVSTPNRSSQMNGSSNTSDMQVPSSGTAVTHSTNNGAPSSIAIREGRPGPSVTGSSSARSRPLSEVATNSHEFRRGIPLDPMLDLSYTSLDDLRLSHIHDHRYRGAMPQLYLAPPQSQIGLENPAYEPDGMHDISSQFSPHTDSTFLRSSTVYTSQQDLYAQVNASKHRRNRMKSSTAAAIAAQKNATSSMFLDTDTLINNDSVVVYDERTAL